MTAKALTLTHAVWVVKDSNGGQITVQVRQGRDVLFTVEAAASAYRNFYYRFTASAPVIRGEYFTKSSSSEFPVEEIERLFAAKRLTVDPLLMTLQTSSMEAFLTDAAKAVAARIIPADEAPAFRASIEAAQGEFEW